MARGSDGGGTPPQFVAVLILVIASFLFWLYHTKRLGPIVQEITGQPGTVSVSGPQAVSTSASGIPNLAMSLVGGTGGVGTTSSSYGAAVSNQNGNIKQVATDTGYAALAATGPIGAAAALVGKVFGWRL